jgi:hypothetical protein
LPPHFYDNKLSSRKKFGGLGLGLDAALLSLGVSVLIAGIYASVILTFAKIHLDSVWWASTTTTSAVWSIYKLFKCTFRTYLGLLLPTIHICNLIIDVPRLYGESQILAPAWPRTCLALALASAVVSSNPSLQTVVFDRLAANDKNMKFGDPPSGEGTISVPYSLKGTFVWIAYFI